MRLVSNGMCEIILKYVIISHVFTTVKGCILLLNGWTPISVSERTGLADIVVSGYVIETYKHVRTKALTYSARVDIMNVYKGNDLVQGIEPVDNNVYVISNFGDKKMCYADISSEKQYIFFLTVYEKRLSAQYDDIFGAAVELTKYNEDEVIHKLGWNLWSAWGSCSRSCNGGVQVRRRKCRKQKGTCDGEGIDRRQCNTFSCKGIRDLLERFGARKLPVGVTYDQQRPFSYNITKIASLYAPVSSIFRNVFPNDFSIIVTVKIENGKSGYLLSLSDIMGKQRLAIKHGDRITFEYYDQNNLPGKKSPSFDVQINDGQWHQFAISVTQKEISLYSDCQNAITKYFGRSEHPSLGTNLMLSIGPYFARYGSPFEGQMEQLIIIPDPAAAAKQCLEQDTLAPEQAIKDDGDVNRDKVAITTTQQTTPKYKMEQTTTKSYSKNLHNEKNRPRSYWSKWSACSVTCGKGRQTRTRFCGNKVVNSCLRGRKRTTQNRACVMPDCEATCPKCFNSGKCNINGTCTCRDGYSGTQCKKVTCNPKCANGGTCVGPNTCACSNGFSGVTCQEEMCPKKCRNGGRCVKPGICSCPYGFLPPLCKPVCTATCHNGGRCVRRNMCKCRRGYTGKECTTPVCRRGCHNGGKCVAPNMCSCPRGYRGRRCHKAVCRPKCKNGGVCIYPNVCKCKRGFYGAKCEKYKCKRTCKNGGLCVGPNKCNCVNGYTGKWCHLGICREACLHGGKCRNNRCRCLPGWRGNRCQYRGCTYEKYVVPYEKSFKKMNREEYTTKCGPWSWKTCVKTRVRYELVYKTMYRTAYRCV